MPEAAVHVGSGKVREIFAARRGTPAAGRERSHLGLRRRPPDARSRTRVACSPGSPPSGSRARASSSRTTCSPCAPTAARPRPASSRCSRSSASSAATSPARAGRTTERTGATSAGTRSPAGSRESERLPEPIFTPATKAQTGHDENISRERGRRARRRRASSGEVERLSIALYATARSTRAQRGIILADTKFEFGQDADGRLVLADEAMTPDSSRFWPADEYEPGRAQPSFDKQFVRDYARGPRLGQDPARPRASRRRSSRARAPATSRPSSGSQGSRSTTYVGRPGGRPR